MKDLIDKLQDLNRKDVMWRYDIQILPEGMFVLHGYAPKGEEVHIPCYDDQELREAMYRRILNSTK